MSKEVSSSKQYISLSPKDSIVVVTSPSGLSKDTYLPEFKITLQSDIPRGHKVAIKEIRSGQPVFKFGHVIGTATQKISVGEHVHVHNVKMPDSNLVDFDEGIPQGGQIQDWKSLPSTFSGYARNNGSAGIRNYIVVVASVNCSATVVKAVCRQFLNREDLEEKEIHGVIPVTHGAGCAQAIGGLSYEVLNRTLAGWVFHPNVVAALVIGLGCEGTTFKSILKKKAEMSLSQEILLDNFGVQEVGGTAEAIRTGIEKVEKLIQKLPSFKRTSLPVSHLKLALNCGGSDAFSSLTANPALGLVSDILVSKGGTVALAEIPECTGAEDLLYRRSNKAPVKEKLKQTFAWWQKYAEIHNVEVNDNLAPGNIAGGITTIIEKSLGAVAKGGSTELTQVVDYSEPITEPGFTLMNTPGFDPVSVTGLVAGSCNLVAFTTGRGSVYGCGIAPTIKISTTSELYERLKGDMDVDAGRVLSDGTLVPTAEILYRFMIDVANGQKTCSEELGLGWEEFVPWPVGETL